MTPEPSRVQDGPDAWARREIALLDEALADVERDLATARREAAAATLAARRYRGRRAIRLANRLHERARPLAHALPLRPQRPASGPTRPPVPRAGTPDPAAYRAGILRALDTGQLRTAVAGLPPDTAGQRAAEGGDGVAAAAKRALSWISDAGWPAPRRDAPVAAREAPGAGGDVDVLFVVDPSFDLHAAARGPIVVAVVDDASDWEACSWLDDVDVVACADEPTVAAVSARRAIVPDIVRSGRDLVDVIRRWATGLRVGIAVGIPSWAVAASWGDLHFARDIQRQLERRGVATRVHILTEWADPVAARDDVAIHVFGLSVRAPLPGQRTVLWVISHPELVTDAMLDDADRVYVASDVAAAAFATRTSTPVGPLHQATDPERFRVDRTGPVHDVLFVGNTRGVRRTAIEWLVPTAFDLAIYGAGWEKQADIAGHVRGRHIDNDQVHRWYGSSRVLLNDHWPDMREQGFISNRLYDGLAAGAFIVSDAVDGLDAEFDGGVVGVRSGGELRVAIHDALGDDQRRREIAERGRRAVLERHTFAHRVEAILGDLAAELGTSILPSRASDAHEGAHRG